MILNRFCEKYKVHLFLAVVVTLMSLSVSFICRKNLCEGFVFSVFQICAVILPGTVIASIYPELYKDDLQYVGWVYFFGYCASILEYFFVFLFRINKYSSIVCLVVGLLSWIFLLRKNRSVLEKCNCILPFLIVALLFFIIHFVIHAGNNWIDYDRGCASARSDILYWVGNTIELSKHFPPLNFRNWPLPYNYHYLSSAQLAFSHLATGIEVPVLCFYFSTVQSCILLTFGSYCLVKNCIDRDIFKIIGIVTLLFSSGVEGVTYATYSWHLNLGFGFEYGYAALFFMLCIIDQMDNDETIKTKNLVLGGIILFITLGLKSSSGVIALVYAGLMSIAWFIRNRSVKKPFAYGLMLLSVFIFGYYSMLNIENYATGIEVIKKGDIFETEYYLNGPMNAIIQPIQEHLGLGIDKIVLILVLCLLVSPLLSIAIVIVVIDSVKKRKSNYIELVSIGTVILGVLFTVCIPMYGLSNIYYIMTVFPVVVMLFLKHFENGITLNKPVKVLLGMILGGSIVLYYLGNVGLTVTDYSAANLFICGIKTIMGDGYGIDTQRVVVTPDQMEVYLWMKENIEEEEPVASNRVGGEIGVFSEKYIVPFYDNSCLGTVIDEFDTDIVAEICKENGIHYLYLDTTNPMGVGEYDEPKYEVLFDSGSEKVLAIM